MELVRWDEQFGGAIERPSTAGAVRQQYAAVIEHGGGWAWVAERDGEVVGLLVATAPEQSGWVAPTTSAAPVAYLACLVVTAPARAAGVGALLVSEAHEAMDRAGAGVTLLHYSGLNPLSGPFWHRCGYRPLWTAWELRPASYLR